MPWARFRFKGQKVYARVGDDGEPVVQEHRVEIRYKPEDPRSYRAAASHISPVDGGAVVHDANSPGSAHAKARTDRRPPKQPQAPDPPGTIVVYTDGACSGNPGPAGWGVLLRYEGHSRELSGFLGESTNNVAELWAIQEALMAVRDPRKPVMIHTDSTYALGVLSKGWKPRANRELVTNIRELLEGFSNVRFTKVPAHSGVPGNERADALATGAIERSRFQ